tara:strand:- start:30352 stop:31140 length:789 start_codon:yes stop_codon:yes gene_type:complete
VTKDLIWFSCRNCNIIKNNKRILEDISFDLKLNQNTIVFGQNGSGKSTILRMIYRFEYPLYQESSYLKLFNSTLINVLQLRKKIGYFSLDIIKRISKHQRVCDVIESAIEYKYQNNLSHKCSSDKKNKIMLILEKYNLTSINSQKFHHLSIGEQTLVLLIRTILNSPKVVLLDEPFAHLDLKYKLITNELIKDIMNSGCSVVMVTHELSNISKDFTNCILVKNGRIVKQGTPIKIINSKNISHIIDKEINIIKTKDRWIVNY